MDANQQGGGNPNAGGGGAYYNYNHPRANWMQAGQEAVPPLLTSNPQFQYYSHSESLLGYPDYIVNQSAAGVAMVAHHGFHSAVSVASRPSAPNAIVGSDYNQYNQYPYQPQPGSAAVVFPGPGYNYNSGVIPNAPFNPAEAAVYAQQPGSAAVFAVPAGYIYDGSVVPLQHAPVYPLGAAAYAQQPGSATVFSAPGHNGNLVPQAFVSQPGAGAAAALSVQQDARANLEALTTNTETSEKLISMLDEDIQMPRVMVTRWVLEDVRMVMASHTGHAVLLALLRAVERANKLDALETIVCAAVSHQYNGASLMEVADVPSGETVLKEFVRLAALHFEPGVLRRLFSCLIDGWKMEQSNGAELLQHFFTTLGFDHCSIFIDELAVPRFSDMATSRFGYMSLIVCLENAGHSEQGTTLQNTVVNHTVQIANEIYGSCFLRVVLERGRNNQLEERIRERVVQNLVELSMGPYGHLVVQECFVPGEKDPSVPLLQRGMDAFLRLTDEQLQELVKNDWARTVLRRLLQTSVERNMAAEEATKLAERILKVWAAGNETDNEPPQEGDRREQALAILQ